MFFTYNNTRQKDKISTSHPRILQKSVSLLTKTLLLFMEWSQVNQDQLVSPSLFFFFSFWKEDLNARGQHTQWCYSDPSPASHQQTLLILSWTQVSYLGEEHAELFERLQQTGISNLLDDKDTFGWLVPRQSLAGGVLNVPDHTNTTLTSGGQNRLKAHLIKIPPLLLISAKTWTRSWLM